MNATETGEVAKFADRVTGLVTDVRKWVEPEWVTKVHPKKFRARDGRIHVLPALYLQKVAARLLLDPVAADPPRTEAIVDLYLMPTYDDAASLYFSGGVWHVHYAFPLEPTADQAVDAGGAFRLDRDSLLRILESIADHAVHAL